MQKEQLFPKLPAELKIDELDILRNLKDVLKMRFGNLVSSICFYGSRVTLNKKDSDFDILILTNKKIKWEQEFEISKLIIDFGVQHDIVFDVQYLSKNEFDKKFNSLPYVRSVQSTGIFL